jgi:hypothetical protein
MEHAPRSVSTPSDPPLAPDLTPAAPRPEKTGCRAPQSIPGPTCPRCGGSDFDSYAFCHALALLGCA